MGYLTQKVKQAMRVLCPIFVLFLTISSLIVAGNKAHADEYWEDVLNSAKGQTVYWNAWGGSDTYNTYIAWIGQRVEEEYGIKLVHVKLSDTADAVRRVLAEKSAGRTNDGTVDLIWINGENFHAMKEQGLLYGPFAGALPSFKYIDINEKPTTVIDFTLPTHGYESPWGMAKLIFIHDEETLPQPPVTIVALREYILNNPGRVTYPSLPDFMGSTFLKQVLYDLVKNPERLQEPVAGDFDLVTKPLWAFLEEINPHLWRGGKQYPKNESELLQLLDDGEIDLAFSFNVGSATNAITEGKLPETARSFVLKNGTIGNSHFVAIPFNSPHKAGAQVVANFILSPEAQAKKQDPNHWGELSVLSMHLLEAEDKARFNSLPRGVATLSNEELGKTLSEPHSSWMTRIEKIWLQKFGSQ